MKAIPTRYGGCLFRSRLEARWAVFFDALKIVWRYEPEGFLLAGGVHYLPDFFLPGFDTRGLYVEVKPLGGDFSKARAFALESDTPILLAEDEPKAGEFLVLGHGRFHGALHFGEVVAEPVAFNAKYLTGGVNAHEYRLYYWPDEGTPPWPDHYGVEHAVSAARSARFEFGQRG